MRYKNYGGRDVRQTGAYYLHGKPTSVKKDPTHLCSCTQYKRYTQEVRWDRKLDFTHNVFHGMYTNNCTLF